MTQAFELAIKPIWLIGVGAAMGLATLALLYFFLFIVHRRLAEEVGGIFRENVVLPVLLIAVTLGLFAGGVTVIDLLGGRLFDRKQESLTSLLRLPFVGLFSQRSSLCSSTFWGRLSSSGFETVPGLNS